MNTPVPRPPLDRAALERVLARAAELQMQNSTESENTGALSDEQVLELGKEVGLTPDGLRQAIAEERGRVIVPSSRGLTGGWFGTETLTATRVVPGTAPGVLSALDSAMRGDLPFDVKRRFADRMQWEPRRGFLAAMRSQLSRAGEGWDLRLAEDIGASVIPIDAHRTHVQIDATLAKERTGAMIATGGSVAASAALVGLGTLLGLAMVAVIPVAGAVAAVGVYGARARYRSRAFRVATALEQVLDRLEFGPAKKQGRELIGKLLG